IFSLQFHCFGNAISHLQRNPYCLRSELALIGINGKSSPTERFHILYARRKNIDRYIFHKPFQFCLDFRKAQWWNRNKVDLQNTLHFLGFWIWGPSHAANCGVGGGCELACVEKTG